MWEARSVLIGCHVAGTKNSKFSFFFKVEV